MVRRLSFLLLLLALVPAPSRAAGTYAVNLTPADLGVTALALTSNPTMTVRVDGYAALTVYLAYTRSSATAVNMSCTSGPTLAVQAPVGVATIATNGAIGMASAAWSYPVSASGTLRMVIAPLNDVYLICTLTGAGAGAGDLVSAYGRLGGIP